MGITAEPPFEADLSGEDRPTATALVVDLEGFEGPIDVLLMLARYQKVDLTKLSILALADQYLAFIDSARELRRLEPEYAPGEAGFFKALSARPRSSK